MIVAAFTTQEAKAVDIAVGAGFNYATCFDQLGIGAKVQVGITPNWRIEPEVVYYFQNRNVSDFQINCNAHYVFNITSKFSIYPFAGLSYSSWSYDYNDKTAVSRFGANIGGGIEYRIINNIGLFAEERAQIISDFSQSMTSVGVKFHF